MKISSTTFNRTSDEGKISFDIPVIIDDVKRYREFEMTRCTYFTIECDLPSPNWVLGLNSKSIPFLLIGLSGIIFKPLGDNVVFESMESIDELFNTIESHSSLYVDTNDIWLPNNLFQDLWRRGQVYRMDSKLFNQTFLYRQERISEDQFLRSCKELRGRIFYSEKETHSFEGWAKLQIEKAKSLYPKSKNYELKWQ